MHHHVITMEQFEDINQKMEVFGRVDQGPVLTTIGKHPSLGSCIVLCDSTDDLVLLSEIPFAAAIPAKGMSGSNNARAG